MMETGDVEDNETTMSQKNNKRRSAKRRKIVKKNIKTKFADLHCDLNRRLMSYLL